MHPYVLDQTTQAWQDDANISDRECFHTTHLHTYITYLLNSQEESSPSKSIRTLKVQEFALLSFGWWTGSSEFHQECINLLHSLNRTSKHFQFSNQPLFAWIRIVTGIHLKLNYCPHHCLLYGGNGIPKSQSHKENSHFGLIRKPNLLFMHACHFVFSLPGLHNISCALCSLPQ